MTATERLRELLDERGVEHTSMFDMTEWTVGGVLYQAADKFSLPDDRVVLRRTCTPEQAIEATLGRGTCHETKIDHYFRGCSVCGYIWEYMYGIGKCKRPNYCPNCGRKVCDE